MAAAALCLPWREGKSLISAINLSSYSLLCQSNLEQCFFPPPGKNKRTNKQTNNEWYCAINRTQYIFFISIVRIKFFYFYFFWRLPCADFRIKRIFEITRRRYIASRPTCALCIVRQFSCLIFKIESYIASYN